MSRTTLRRQALLDSLIARGFDRSYIIRRERGVHAACSECQALVINGVACHEQGCPHQTRDCDECGYPIPRSQRLCESCAHDAAVAEGMEHTFFPDDDDCLYCSICGGSETDHRS